jgi:transposase
MAAMQGKIGCPARIVTPVPYMREPAKGAARELPEKAKFRLKIFDRYFRESLRFSQTGKPDVSLTCRHFGIHRSYCCRWKARYDKRRLSSPENRPARPGKRREPRYSCDLVNRIREIRKAGLAYSAKKIRPVVLRELEGVSAPSVSTLGRLISRENLFFRPGHEKAHKTLKKRSKSP